MLYLISFLEGIITFISPCLLPTTYFVDKDGNMVAYANSMINAETLERGIEMIK